MTTIAVVQTHEPIVAADLVIRPGYNMLTGDTEFRAAYPDITTLEEDLLRVAASIYCTDLAVKRGEREQFVRDLEVEIPVTNFHALENAREDLEMVLYILSSDNWTIRFRRLEQPPEAPREWPRNDGQVLLFSGGLDSLAAAYERLRTDVLPLVLVSHVTLNKVTRRSQEELCSWLEESFPGRLSRAHFHVSGRTREDLPFPSEREDTQRTRSFMFLVLAALVARRRGHSQVLMIAENGQLAIHLPLTQARVSAFSTKTAHPEFLAEMEAWLSLVLGFRIEIRNPFLYLTKAEVVRRLVAEVPETIPMSGSCWKAARLGGAHKHCGECVPCLVRRIALEANGLVIHEFQRDLLALDIAQLESEDTGKRNLSDLVEFVNHFAHDELRRSITETFPELLNGTFDAGRAIEMYTRFASEALDVLNRYPGVRGIL